MRLTVRVFKALNNNKKCSKRLRQLVDLAIAGDPTSAMQYARTFIHGPFPAGEPAIAKDAECSYYYASEVLHGPFPAGEPAIATRGGWAMIYARYILKGPFPLGEKAILSHGQHGAYLRFLELSGFTEDATRFRSMMGGGHTASASLDYSRHYLAFEIDAPSRAEILSIASGKFRKKDCHHITVAFNVTEESCNELMESLKDASLEVVGYQSGEGIDCVAVEVNGSTHRPDGSTYHITISLAPGHKPFESNALLRQQGIQQIIPITIQGELKLLKK